MAKKRVNRNSSSFDIGQIASLQFNAYAGASKSMQTGPDFRKVGSNNFTSGQTAASGLSVATGSMLWLYNNDSVVHFFTLSTNSAVAAPSAFASGCPLAPGSWFQVSTGENSTIRTDSANVGVYIVNDDTALVDQ